MASFGRLDEAEAAALSSIERFDAAGEVLLVVNALNALAGVAAAKGDFEGASVADEALLERCRATGQHPYLPFCLVSLAGVRARQGDAAAADHLYHEAIGCCYNPWLSADAMVGQAAVARQLGDLLRARGLLDTAAERYRDADLPAGQARVLAGLAWWAIGADQPATAVIFAADAVRAAKAIGDPESQLLADSAQAPAKAIADPTQRNTDNFVALARQRASGLTHRSLTDERDLGGARDSAHSNGDLNQQSRSSSSLRADHLKPCAGTSAPPQGGLRLRPSRSAHRHGTPMAPRTPGRAR